MLTEIYVEALLVDEELADQVWEAWDSGEIDDFLGGVLPGLRLVHKMHKAFAHASRPGIHKLPYSRLS